MLTYENDFHKIELLQKKRGVYELKIGMIGLGKMGLNLAQNILRGGFEVVGFDPNADVLEKAKEVGVEVAQSLEELVEKMSGQRVI